MKSKRRGIRLRTINTWLRRIGLVFVVEDYPRDPLGKTTFWIEKSATYDRRSDHKWRPQEAA